MKNWYTIIGFSCSEKLRLRYAGCLYMYVCYCTSVLSNGVNCGMKTYGSSLI